MLRRLRDQWGVETIEAAITAPVAVLLVVSVLQFGVLVYARQMVQEAARHGVRQGVVAVGNPVGTAVGAASAYGHGALPFGVGVTVEAPGGVVGSTLRLRVSTNVPNILGGVLGFFGYGSPTFKIEGVAEGRMEGWGPP